MHQPGILVCMTSHHVSDRRTELPAASFPARFTSARIRLGVFGEDVACAFLERAGYRIIERNWRCARGEIDIVALSPDPSPRVLVFVEVKTRSGSRFGHPLESLTPTKVARLRLLAGAWCQARGTALGQAGDERGTTEQARNPRKRAVAHREVRIDAIGIVAPRNQPFTLEHVIGVGA